MPDLSERILASARTLFYENGYYGTATHEIAKKAGTSESGIFRLFKNKYGVLMAVYNEAWKKVNSRVNAILVSTDSPVESILKIVNTIFSMYDDDRMTINFIIINTGNTDTLILERKEESIISQENLHYIFLIQELCKKCFDRKETNGFLTPESLCEGIMAIIEGVLLGWYLSDNSKDYPYKIGKDKAINLIKSLFISLEV